MDWTLSDFVVAGVLLLGLGSGIWIAAWKGGRYKVVAVAAVILLFLWLWAELAVGVFTNWGS